MIILFKNYSRLLLLGTMAAFPFLASAATITFPDVPLASLSSVSPNIMLTLDTSSSMFNAVPDAPYDANTTYNSACTNTLPALRSDGTQYNYDLVIHSTNKTLYVGQDSVFYYTNGLIYVEPTRLVQWGTGSGRYCFNSTANYQSRMLADKITNYRTSYGGPSTYPEYNIAANFGFAIYSGNYLNWYFNPTNITGVTWTNKQPRKPLDNSGGLVLNRIDIARKAAADLTQTMDSRLRVGYSTYHSVGDGEGGTLKEAIGLLGPAGSAKRTSLYNSITGTIAFGNTPIAETLSDIGRYFTTGYTGNLTLHPATTQNSVTQDAFFTTRKIEDLSSNGSAAPITISCQKNFEVLLTDGRPTADDNVSSWVQDYDGDCVSNAFCISPFDRDRKSNRTYETAGTDYMDDIAKALYEIDLRPDFPAEVDGTQFLNNIVSYFIGFADQAIQNDALLLSAASQGGGRLIIANNSSALNKAFQDIINSILASSASLGAVSVNSNKLTAGSLAFATAYNSANWSGTLNAYAISTGVSGACPSVVVGNFCPSTWEAGNKLSSIAATSRVILTSSQTSSVRTGIPFRWASLDSTEQLLLNTNPRTLLADSNGSARLDYLRGSQTNEAASANPVMRTRSSLLGDIVNSDPFYVGAPPFSYGFDNYATFKSGKANRTPIVYVAANDGMLHGFKASDGTEILAYIPTKAFGNAARPLLSYLTDPLYPHYFTTDGSPTVGDAYINSSWQTMLVAGMRSGGQGLYALNITDPSSFTEANATSVVAWEFNDSDDADLGNTYSQPLIVKLNDNKWYTIIGNGYNNTAADGSVSATGTAALMIIGLAGPGVDRVWGIDTDYYKLAVTGGSVASPNGLSSASAVDINRDGKIDYVFAGDLEGNMWRFNLTSSSPGSWTSTKIFTAVNPLVSTIPQAITARPEIGFNTLTTANMTDVVVYFGTGTYLGTNDPTQLLQKTQSFYAIFDDLATTVTPPTRTSLQAQSVLSEFTPGGASCSALQTSACARITSNNSLDIATKKGWYMDLYNTSNSTVTLAQADTGLNLGERAVTAPQLRNGRIIFTTLIPSDNSCQAGGTGWIMELNALNGARAAIPVLDIDSNQQVNNSDLVTVNGSTVSPGGIRSRSGILPRPTVMTLEDSEIKINAKQSVVEIGNNLRGRVSWREINVQ